MKDPLYPLVPTLRSVNSELFARRDTYLLNPPLFDTISHVIEAYKVVNNSVGRGKTIKQFSR